MLPARQVTPEDRSGICWIEIRCSGCGRLLQKIEQYGLRPGKHIEIKCSRCKAVNSLGGNRAALTN
jgi:phage FluMu protein Com